MTALATGDMMAILILAIKSAQLTTLCLQWFVWENQYSRMIKHDIIYSPYFPIYRCRPYWIYTQI